MHQHVVNFFDHVSGDHQTVRRAGSSFYQTIIDELVPASLAQLNHPNSRHLQHMLNNDLPTSSTPLLAPAAPTSPSIESARLTATALLATSLLGTGVLAMARAASLLGLVPFVAISLIAAATSHTTAIMLAKASTPDAMTIASLCREHYGPKFELLASLCIVLQQIGACTGYVVVVGDTFGPLLKHWMHMPSLREWEVRVALMAAIVLPISLIRDLSALKITSAASVAAISAFCLTVVLNYLIVLANPDARRDSLMPGLAANLTGPHYLPADSGALRALGLVCFAYFNHQNVLAIYATFKKTSTDISVFAQASQRAVALACVACVCVGLSGYLTFLSETQADILNNFLVKDTYISSVLNIVRACYGTGLLFAFPMMLWEARVNSYGLIWGPNQPMSLPIHVGLTVGLIALTTVIGCLVKDLGLVFGLVGSTCTPIMAYVIPPAVYAQSGHATLDNKEHLAKLIQVSGLVFIAVGVIVWLLDVVVGLWDA